MGESGWTIVGLTDEGDSAADSGNAGEEAECDDRKSKSLTPENVDG